MGKPFLEGPSERQRVVLENQHGLFLQIPHEVLVGSGVIVTRASRQTVFDRTPEAWTATYEMLLQAKTYLDTTLAPAGYTVGWNVGDAGGQSVPHVHLHVIPRFRDEPLEGLRYHLKQPENKRP